MLLALWLGAGGYRLEGFGLKQDIRHFNVRRQGTRRLSVLQDKGPESLIRKVFIGMDEIV